MIQKIGHRGVKGYCIENTLSSFQKAIDLKVDAIELDVHICASGELVVFHDFTLGRMTNGSGEVKNLTLEELKKLKVSNAFEIPTLEEVIALVDRRCIINIELKGRETAKATAVLLENYVQKRDYSFNEFIVSSFQLEELEVFSKLNKNIPLAILTQASVEQAIKWAEEFSAKYIHPHFSLLTEENCMEATQKGFQINTWTVNDIIDIERLKKYKINGIISDFPDRI